MRIELPTGITLVVDRHGDPARPAVVFLHGLSSNRATWRAVIDHVVARGDWQVVNVDQRGHGDSSHAASVDAYDAGSYAADVAALVEHLGVAPVVLVGHSLGGVVAHQLAVSRPELVRAVLGEDPPTFEGDAARRAASPAAKFFPAMVAAVRDLQARGADWREYGMLAPPGVSVDDAADHLRGLTTWDPTTMEAAIAGAVWRGFDPVAPVTVPFTVVRADPSVGAVFEPGDADRLTAANPHVTVAMVPGADHSVHGPGTLAGFVAHLDTFLDSLV